MGKCCIRRVPEFSAPQVVRRSPACRTRSRCRRASPRRPGPGCRPRRRWPGRCRRADPVADADGGGGGRAIRRRPGQQRPAGGAADASPRRTARPASPAPAVPGPGPRKTQASSRPSRSSAARCSPAAGSSSSTQAASGSATRARSRAKASAGASSPASSCRQTPSAAGSSAVQAASAGAERAPGQDEAMPGHRHRPQPHRRMLQLGLAAVRVDRRIDRGIDPRRRGEAVGPVHRHEDAARGRCRVVPQPQHRAAPGAVHPGQAAIREPRRIGRVDAGAPAPGYAPSAAAPPPVRVMVCHWSRSRPVSSRSGNAGGGGMGRGAEGRGDEAGGRREAPARLARPRHRPAGRRHGAVVRIAQAGEAGDVEGPRRRPRQRRSRRHARGRSPPAPPRRRPRPSRAGRRPGRRSTSPAAPRPAPGGSARWRLMTRSELVTVPSFSPQPSAGRRMRARSTVSESRLQSEATRQGTRRMRRAHRIRRPAARRPGWSP